MNWITQRSAEKTADETMEKESAMAQATTGRNCMANQIEVLYISSTGQVGMWIQIGGKTRQQSYS
ncbi:MAG: hypothetical protein RLO04_07545 [Limnobacter sp.]|uniref:hypothetical protein n=1 Tax=Limnobacter sp. TaxID=2003368 RepID=UPI0032EB1503